MLKLVLISDNLYVCSIYVALQAPRIISTGGMGLAYVFESFLAEILIRDE